MTTPTTDVGPAIAATGDRLAREVAPLGVGSKRIISLDIVRGFAMVVMAIDHVRVYSGQPAGGPTPGIFFTRWITNYSAPIFVFLAGTAAYLYGSKFVGTAGRRRLAWWLLTRGAWLIFLELTVVRFAWTFNFDYAHYVMAGVLWAIGWSMIGLAGLIYLPVPVILAVGLAIVGGHNLIDPHRQAIRDTLQANPWGWALQILYFGGAIDIHGSQLIVLYSIIPWVGVMATGYAFGVVMRWTAEKRARYCYALGALAVALFLVLRGFDIYGDPRPWHVPVSGQEHVAPALLRFLNTTKYPASLLFLLMTIGPTLIAIPLLEHARGSIARVLAVFGRVPFFFYVFHIALIHLVALGVSLIRLGSVSPWLFANHPVMVPPPPEGYTWSLPLLYLVWVLVTVTLYFPCRWYADLKARGDNPWLRYL